MVLADVVDVVSPHRVVHANGGSEMGGVLSDRGGRGWEH
jgi:hypothetical protein